MVWFSNRRQDLSRAVRAATQEADPVHTTEIGGVVSPARPPPVNGNAYASGRTRLEMEVAEFLTMIRDTGKGQTTS